MLKLCRYNFFLFLGVAFSKYAAIFVSDLGAVCIGEDPHGRKILKSGSSQRQTMFVFSLRAKDCTWSGTLYVSGKLPTHPSPKLTLTLTSHLRQNNGLGEG